MKNMGKELELAIKIAGKLDGSLASAVNKAQAQLNTISKSANRIMTVGTAAVAAASVKLINDSVQTYQSYQSALNSAAATAGVERGTAEYEAMNKAAREAGRTTVKTAEESANALEYMALAGWSVEDSTKALMPVLKLSAATGAELATTSDLVTDSMANLGLGIDELNHYLDVSATANNKSNQTAMQLQEAYLGVGGVLNNLNSPIEESAAVLGVLANRGTKGSEAGTALSAILVNMQKRSGDAYKAMKQLGVSMYDTTGNARSIIDVFQEISDKTSGMTEENRNLMYQMIGGKSHVDSFAKIMQGFTTETAEGAKEVYSLMKAFQNCDGALDKLYAIKTDTLEGSVQTLNSAFDDMKISIGERIAPTLKESIDTLTEKIPQIENIIVNSLEKIIPAASKVLDYLVNNSDKVISGAIGMAKAFAAIKITSGTIKGIESIVTLSKNLYTLNKAVGSAKVLQGVIGTFTGVSTTTGTLGGAITGFTGTLLSSLGPLSLFAGGVLAVVVATNAAKTSFESWYKYNYKWGAELEKQTDIINVQADKILRLNEYKKELSELELVINQPSGNASEIDAARTRIEEIADLLSKEYNLNINMNTGNLSQAAQDVKSIVDGLNLQQRREINTDIAQYISSVNEAGDRYKTAKVNLPEEQAQYDSLENNLKIIDSYLTSIQNQSSAFRIGGDLDNYADGIQKIAEELNKAGLLDEINKINAQQFNEPELNLENISNLNNETAIKHFVASVYQLQNDMDTKFNNSSKSLQNLKENLQATESSALSASESLAGLLAADVANGDSVNIINDKDRFILLGKSMRQMGMEVDNTAIKFAAAKAGYVDFAAAISNGKAQEMAQNFIDYQNAIGGTADAAISGAALIQNGFENVKQATEAGGDAIKNIIADMKSFGDSQGLFDGITVPDGIADKLSDMAHAMQLIPENKTITIDANGNFSVIEEAENQIASLKSIGNVDVSVNANGDFSIVNEVTGDVKTLQGMGAVSLEINADGNIDVLNKAGEVIANIDSKNAKVDVAGIYASIKNSIDLAKRIAEENLGDNKISVDTTLQGGTLNVEPLKTFILSSGKALLGQNMQTTQSVNVSLKTTDNATPNLQSVKKAIEDIPLQHSTNLMAFGNATLKVANLQAKINKLPTSKNITINIKTNGDVPKLEKGIRNARGGVYMVNDQRISDPREVIEYKDIRYWYEGRNVLTTLPSGSNVYTAAQSRAFINGSHKNGLDRVPFDGYIAELHQGEQVLTADEASDYSGGTFGDILDRLKEMLDELHNRGDGRNRGSGQNSGDSQIVFSPQITVIGNGDKETIMPAMRMSYNEFKEFMDEYERDKRRKVF